ncbi:DUF6407 family protein [Bacillus sp. FJAT-45350]|uniref:DUF6407 family protein n=1 Tax=Bacillus sp. FJAT-45350 TaxID=2011014 RepID=UPI000BB76F24|nr:DUF6407 family protein [Bacillus sp. FJAT-45350]
MKARKSFTEFVEDTIDNMKDFDSNDLNCIRESIRNAIHYYDLKSNVEETEAGRVEVLYITSMAEENMLLKIVELAVSGNVEQINLESVYESRVVRSH